LYLPYDGPYQGHGAHRKYGDKPSYRQQPDKCLKKTTTQGQIETRIYQIQALYKEFSQPLNVVIIVKTNLQKAGLPGPDSCEATHLGLALIGEGIDQYSR